MQACEASKLLGFAKVRARHRFEGAEQGSFWTVKMPTLSDLHEHLEIMGAKWDELIARSKHESGREQLASLRKFRLELEEHPAYRAVVDRRRQA